MQGVITTRNLFFNAGTIIAGFGFVAWMAVVTKTLTNRKTTTFLEAFVSLRE